MIEQSRRLSPLRSVARLTLFSLLALVPLAGEAQSLAGSRSSMLRQSAAAQQHEYTYLRTSSDVYRFVNRGLLVRLSGNSNYRVGPVSFPYARPEVKTFVERLSRQYRSACGEKLVVTSLTRPLTRQPANASHLSVHPTGMALDLRRSQRSKCRAWLEDTLLTLEDRGVLEATKENHPPHYHVSLYPSSYRRYVLAKGGTVTGGKSSGSKVVHASSKTYRVGRGDTLWEIAKRHGTSISRLKQENGIRTSRLKPGQKLLIPTAR
ncbi:MAG TPA: DUF5715 family protein [Thermoanaerobaculia bacterium]|nr:DUF5715 family protein [Thermoanaerobaculia bacterium]